MYMNTIHEGTNNAIKTGEHAVLPQHSIDKSAKIMADRDKWYYTENEKLTARDVHSKPLWTDDPTAAKLTQTGDSLRVEQDSQVDKYSSIQVDHNKFLVIRSVEQSHGDTGSLLLPKFQRVRTVYIDDDGILFCDCQYSESMGIPCRHLGHVCKYHNLRPNFQGFTHLDTSVVWWRTYQHYAHKPLSELYTEHERQLQVTVRKLFADDIKGPRVDTTNVSASISFPCNYMVGSESLDKFRKQISINEANELFTLKPAIQSLLNYSAEEVNTALSKANGVAFALSQEVWHGESSQHEQYFTSCDDDDSDEGMLPFDGNNRVAEAHAAAIDSRVHTTSTHQQLNPIFKEIVQCVDANSSQLPEVKSQLENILFKVKQNLAFISALQPAPEGRFVSSSVPLSKRRKIMITKLK